LTVIASRPIDACGDPHRTGRIFTRLDRSADGWGIGLALVRRIVEVHGGRIWVESEGAGSTS
jgi:signal transduction histidine kinase